MTRSIDLFAIQIKRSNGKVQETDQSYETPALEYLFPSDVTKTFSIFKTLEKHDNRRRKKHVKTSINFTYRVPLIACKLILGLHFRSVRSFFCWPICAVAL